MSNKLKYPKAFTVLIATAIFITGCTEKREAKLPFDERESVFSISELDTLNGKTEIVLKTDSEKSDMTLAESSKAVVENSLISVSKTKAPSRLRFMFDELQITGKPSKEYKVAVSVDQQYVTAYKVISSHQELSTLESQIAQSKEEINLQKDIQKTVSQTKATPLVNKLTTVRKGKLRKQWSAQEEAYVPLFRFKIARYGKLERAKNANDESTATLKLKDSSWNSATHIQISTEIKDRIAFGIADDMDRTFVMNSINNKVLTAKSLNEDFKIPLALNESAKVLTLLDVSSMHVFEITQLYKAELTDSQKSQLKLNNGQGNVRKCSAELVNLLPKAEQKDCIMVLRYDVPVSYVTAELPKADAQGRINTDIKLKDIPASQNVGLVRIQENVQAVKVEANNQMDPRTTIKVSDIKNKEFFYRRTLMDAPAVSSIFSGMSGTLTIAKFELYENRIAVVAADQIQQAKNGSTSTDTTELMSLPVKYLKYEKVDASGNKYSMPKLIETGRSDAEFIELNWLSNTISQDNSPYSAVDSYCASGLADQTVSTVDMRLDQGILNFTVDYTTTLRRGCIAREDAKDTYNGTDSAAFTARLKERVSFMVNDKSKDKSFVAEIPFSAQNKMGFGVWTLGLVQQDENGLYGRSGQEKNPMVVHDFRNGKKLVYTVTGLEPDTNINPELRDLYIQWTKNGVDAWDAAYKLAFKGTPEGSRSGRFVEVQFNGYNGVSAELGDLDKNIIHYNHKVMHSAGILGVSQVGPNPRSGIVVSDSLIMYAGNLQMSVASSMRMYKTLIDWNKEKAAIKDILVKQMQDQEAQKLSAAAPAKVLKNKKATAAEKSQAANSQASEIAAKTQSLTQNKNLDNVAKFLMTSQFGQSFSKEMIAKNTAKPFNFGSPTASYGWMDRALKALAKTPGASDAQLRMIMAKEILNDGKNNLTKEQQQELQLVLETATVQNKIAKEFESKPGCMMLDLPANVLGFTKLSFNEAMKVAIESTLYHELGHSQGLTHNFTASNDKANFNRIDGEDSNINYSSVMDYIPDDKMNWQGLGSYDVHAIRASQTGRVEAHDSTAQNPKYVNISTLKSTYAPQGWYQLKEKDLLFNALSKEANTKPKIKSYKYCTDKDVGYDPLCARHDVGATALEIAQDEINNYNMLYDVRHHAWDRIEYNDFNAWMAQMYNSNTIMGLKRFKDEAFYLLIEDDENPNVDDFIKAAVLAYTTLNNIVTAPETKHNFIPANKNDLTNSRFSVTKYNYKKDEKTFTDYVLVEAKSLDDIQIDKGQRIDTVGYIMDKVAALNALTSRRAFSYKHALASINFSYVDFEKFLLGMEPTESIYVNLMTDIFSNNLRATIATPHNPMLRLDTKIDPSVELTYYSALYSILNLESSSLRDKDNWANLFKVGTSVGAAPSDRISLNKLGVDKNSTRKINYFATDGALVPDFLVSIASGIQVDLSVGETAKTEFTNLAMAQYNNLLTGMTDEKSKASEGSAKAKLIEKLNSLNKNGQLVSAELLKANPNLTIEKQIEMLMSMNYQVLSISFGLAENPKDVELLATQMNLRKTIESLEENLMIFSINSRTFVGNMGTILKQFESNKEAHATLSKVRSYVRSMFNERYAENRYGDLVKNIDFLSQITKVTDPELSAQ